MAPLSTFFRRAVPGPQTDASLAELPASVLSKVGALAPPPGVTPNLTNPDDIGYMLVAIIAIGLVIISTCVFIRGWMKFEIANRHMRLAWSDLIFTLAILTIIVVFVAGLLSTNGYGGTIGIHQWDVALSRIFTRQSLVSLSLICTLNLFALGLVKVTIFLTYIELFTSVTWIRISCTIGGLITGAFYLVIFIVTCVLIFPHGNETFASHIFTDSPLRIERTSYPVAAVGVAIDVYLFIVPLIAVSRLKGLNRRKKIGTALIFATGFLAILASAISFIYRRILKESGDHTWNLVPLYLIIFIELCLGIIISCTPHIAKFFRRYEKSLLKTGSRINSFFCCKVTSRKEIELKKSTSTSEGSNSAELEKPRNTKKLYPALDLSTFNGTGVGTIGETNIDNIGGIQSEQVKAPQHPATQYPADTHWAERRKDIQEQYCDGIVGDSHYLKPMENLRFAGMEV